MNISIYTKRALVVIIAITAMTVAAFAQGFTLRGSVSNENGEGAIGVSVLIDGSSVGTLTDNEGAFLLPGVMVGQTVTVSCLGYITQNIKIENNSPLNIALQLDSRLLDEVVVVGYGTQTRTNISGAVSVVKTDELPKAASASVGTMLRGRSAGLNITSNSASPGASMNIEIRGGLSGQKPLVIIDGVPQLSTSTVWPGTSYSGVDKDNSLINLNPDDIETINILKDASAASIYGSDASGGVILISTKRGKAGTPQVSYSGSVSIQRIKDAPDFMNAKDFMTEQNKIFDELGRGNEKRWTASQIDAFVGNGTDWMDEVTRTGVVNEHNLSVNGGSGGTRYLASVSLYDHKGIARNNSMNRVTGRLNLDQEFGKKLKGGVNTSFTRLKYNDVPLGDARQDNSALFYSAMTFIPTVSVYDENGDFSDNPIRNIYPNPVSLLEITDETNSNDIAISGYLEYKPIEEFAIRATVGTDIKDTQADQYIPTTTKKGKSLGGQASKQNGKAQLNLINVVGTFSKNFADRHDLSVMAGWEFKKNIWSGMGIVASQFPYDGALMNNIGTSEMENPNISSYKGSSEMASFFGRVNYVLMDKYIATVNLRIDGSSNFSPEHQWGMFPGVSLAWKIDKEEWMRNFSALSNLKLRAGYGQTGNAGSLTGINSYYTVSRGAAVMDGSMVNGIGLSKLGNDNLKWETLTDINVGLDFGFFGDRVSGSVDIYQRDRNDVILSKSLMSYQEISSIDYNSAAVYRSRGLDFSIHSVNVVTRNFDWSTDINFSWYRNRTIRRDAEFIPQPYQAWVEDWGNIYAYRTDGLVQPGESFAHLPSSAAGAIRYLDLNGYKYDENGEKMRDSEGRYIITEGADGILDAADMVFLHNSTPIPFSINNTFRWKNWDANVYIYGSLNGWKINDVRYQSIYGMQDLTYGVNALSEVKNRWSASNPEGNLPGVAEANSGIDPEDSDFFLEKAWYLRLDNVSLGYTFPDKLFGGYLKSTRLYIAARNLFVLTPYKGMDPETGNGIGAYPNQMSFALGLSCNF